ncbi:bacterial low temperature requirement A protein-domain-containing protein [Phaeosphaeria sp. MPI-PUGE-AT-0046c]|nr:bacterial low temperature requirement A protein-domain-containing protein [Phaeosphaeria sp. MPI-PUGE-AT-0046c]
MSEHSLTTSPSRAPKEHRHAHDHRDHDNTNDGAPVPWFPSPMDGWNDETESFAPRHEASTIELFFDLWFVANLATFTQYHAITNRYNFWSYIAFFLVLWTSWFHVVCFDARFTSDSVWERACKIIHFCSFAAFALAGYKYMPFARDTDTATPHWIYRTLCFAVMLSRAWLALQYLITAILCFSRKHRQHRLTFLLAINCALFLAVAAVFGGLLGGFSKSQTNRTGLLIGVYVTFAVEFFGSLFISMTWRKLSFQATHIGERLGLLGLIIIGEGVIGTTKTITRTMGKNGKYAPDMKWGPTFAESTQIFCIVLILLYMWMLYFDKVPNYRFGVVKQQLWMALHLPFHLAVLGVVEGAQQLAQARYIYHNTLLLINNAYYACVGQHFDGQALATNLTKNIQYFKINESAQGEAALRLVWDEVYILGNATDICSDFNTTRAVGSAFDGVPMDFAAFFGRAIGAMFQSFGLDIPSEDKTPGAQTALESYAVVYTYFWSAIILLLVCYTITALLAEVGDVGHWRNPIRYTGISVMARTAMIVLAAVLLGVGLREKGNHLWIQQYIGSSWVLPTVVLALWTICLSDRVERLWIIRETKKTKYASVAAAEHERSVTHEMGAVRKRGTNAYGYPSRR